MIQLVAISQPTIIDNNEIDIYKGLINGDNCRLIELPNHIAAVNSLNLIIQAQNDSIQLYSSREKDFNEQITKLNIDKQNTAVDIINLQNKKVPWYRNEWGYLVIGFIGGILLMK